jgi:CO/xanthine dehydrogenase Mo-binding subunit
VDPGIAVRPKNIALQMQSGIVYGLSALLAEKVAFKKGRTTGSQKATA